MITVADIVNRSLKGARVTDRDLATSCEWCECKLTLADCQSEKTGEGLMYRCPSCADVLLIINRAADSLPRLPTPNTRERESPAEKQAALEASRERSAEGFRINGWRIRSTEDLMVGNVLIPRVPHGALRKFW